MLSNDATCSARDEELLFGWTEFSPLYRHLDNRHSGDQSLSMSMNLWTDGMFCLMVCADVYIHINIVQCTDQLYVEQPIHHQLFLSTRVALDTNDTYGERCRQINVTSLVCI